MKLLKDLIKESTWGKRKFGESLPTIADYKAEYDKKQEKLANAHQKIDGIKQNLDNNLKKVNETLPAFAKQWKGLEKAEKIYTKSVLDLGKAVGKVDKKAAKEIVGLYRTLSASMSKYKELLSREIMDKLQ